MLSRFSLRVYLCMGNFFVLFLWLTPVSNFNPSGQLVMEILHLKDFGMSSRMRLSVNFQHIGRISTFL